jgi:uncharacterized protein with HEPN domain
MPRDPRKYLFDVRQSCERLHDFVGGKSFADYQDDVMLRSAVERQFEIIGEALGQLAKTDPELVDQITDAKQIIGFRNILIHGYAIIDNAVVWDIIQTKLPLLHEQTARLLEP